MTKYLIIDDEYVAHDIIQGYCDLLPNMQLLKNCYDAIEALEYLKENSVDLIFLDLNMPKLKGFDFLKILPAPPKVIVTTAYSEFALESYELDVIDYLLKPFSFERFLKAVNKATNPPKEKSIHSISKKSIGDRRIFLRSNKKHTQVILDDILYLEASGNYTKIILTTETISIREKISNVLSLLPSEEFLQVHKSFAIATKHIKSVEGNRICIGETIVPIGKLYKANVNRLLS